MHIAISIHIHIIHYIWKRKENTQKYDCVSNQLYRWWNDRQTKIMKEKYQNKIASFNYSSFSCLHSHSHIDLFSAVFFLLLLLILPKSDTLIAPHKPISTANSTRVLVWFFLFFPKFVRNRDDARNTTTSKLFIVRFSLNISGTVILGSITLYQRQCQCTV